MARILIVGGHGKVALLLAPILVSQGDEVTSVIRNPAHADTVRATGATPVVFDIEHGDREAIAAVIAGQDAVVWSAGAGGGDPARTTAVDLEAAVRSMDAAADAGVRRYVMVSYFDASPDHGIDPANSFYAYAEAKAAADEHLRASELAWTVLGPSRLTLDPPTGLIDTTAETSGEVSRANVAQVIAAAVHDDTTIGRTIRFNDGTVPIADAIRG
ncbi:SDR family oxidoreductase [Microbacterium sp. H1-D42]|uniref:SDR family oxidoreductase n=1 Tax=Microbacterium sp. H1-D42 TaxID=2925844 RepID=UPI001F537647|nr:SDR family oxidoreductase [Microbacterium sp. H1-D42]UNK71829.1 SDR family oxidoreductase [Microbacterium sp. H1-D42]